MPLSMWQVLVLVAFFLYLLYYFACVVRKPRFICSATNMRAFLSLNLAPLLEECFWPPIWCIAPNMQCLVSMALKMCRPLLPYHRQVLLLADGGTVALEWLNEGLPPPVVLFLTGLTSDSQAYYIRSLVPVVSRLHCPCVVLNNRGQGGLPLANHKLVSGLSTGDLAEVVAAIRERYPEGCELVVVGCSLGGVLLSHYLIQTGDAAQIDAGISISAPFDLLSSYENLMNCSTNFLVNAYLAHTMLDVVRKNPAAFDSSGFVTSDRLLQCRTLYDFDNCYTAPLYGFPSVLDYYVGASLVGRLSTIRRPLLFLVADDDVFGSPETLPAAEIEGSPWLSAVVTPRGGHLGFIDGWLWPLSPSYAERLTLAFVRGLLDIVRGPPGPLGLKSLADLGGSSEIGAERVAKQEDRAVIETSNQGVLLRRTTGIS
ncbi:protein ABHD1-like [Haemaphysalis longicornis]